MTRRLVRKGAMFDSPTFPGALEGIAVRRRHIGDVTLRRINSAVF